MTNNTPPNCGLTSRLFAPRLRLLVFAQTLLLASCAAGGPGKITAAICAKCSPAILGLQKKYPLKSLLNETLKASGGRKQPLRMHVYFEGDGRGWAFARLPPKNPTTKTFTALKLMQLDNAPAAYINRPCYGYDTLPTNCDKSLWTSARYSTEVITSLSDALTELKTRFNVKDFVLIGHSGGGSLAILVADLRADIAAVVTLAANLDHAHWTGVKHFSALKDSKNAARVALKPEVLRWHFAGLRDQQVPIEVIKRAVQADRHAQLTVLPDADHHCCWHGIWHKTLAELAIALGTRFD